MRGDSVEIMAGFPDNSIDFILTDPPYLVGFKDRSGRSIANDVSDEWVLPATREEIAEALAVAISLNTGAALTYTAHALDAFDALPKP